MKLKWTSSNKTLLKFLISLLFIGIITGIIVYIKQPSIIKTSIINELDLLDITLKEARQNNFIYHLIIFSWNNHRYNSLYKTTFNNKNKYYK